jgi:hypothetical protein
LGTKARGVALTDRSYRPPRLAPSLDPFLHGPLPDRIPDVEDARDPLDVLLLERRRELDVRHVLDGRARRLADDEPLAGVRGELFVVGVDAEGEEGGRFDGLRSASRMRTACSRLRP